MSFQVSVRARRGNPQAVWWGLDQISRINPKRDFAADYANTALLTFASTAPNEHYAGGDRFGNVMLAGTLPDFVADNVDTDYPGGPNEDITLHDNEFFWLPKGLWQRKVSCRRFGGWWTGSSVIYGGERR